MSILFVDDEQSILDLYKGFAELEDVMDVDFSKSGTDAWDKIQNKKYSLVVTDIVMANGDGLELIDRIKTELQDQPTIVISTGYPEKIPKSRDKDLIVIYKPLNHTDFSDILKVFK